VIDEFLILSTRTKEKKKKNKLVISNQPLAPNKFKFKDLYFCENFGIEPQTPHLTNPYELKPRS